MVSLTKIDKTMELLKSIEKDYTPSALASSYSLEDMILTDLICKYFQKINIITLDTGRLPEQTYALMQKVKEKYGDVIKVYFPDFNQVQNFVSVNGPNAFYQSVQLRKDCCNLRKLEPLGRALKDKKAWITGLRAEQSVTRENVVSMQWDNARGIPKFNPLCNWSLGDLWSYVETHNVPYNELYRHNYTSIGCAPCTRAVKQGEDIRSGRWWWEAPESKECGLHNAVAKAESA